MLDALAPIAATRLYLAPEGGSRSAVDPAGLAARYPGRVVPSVGDALGLAARDGQASLIVVAGSLVLVGEARAQLLGLPRDPPVALWRPVDAAKVIGLVTMPSFDIVSKVPRNEVDNAYNQAEREIAQRFDFKDTHTELEKSAEAITIDSASEDRARAAPRRAARTSWSARRSPCASPIRASPRRPRRAAPASW